jgi:hypothetical protein
LRPGKIWTEAPTSVPTRMKGENGNDPNCESGTPTLSEDHGWTGFCKIG